MATALLRRWPSVWHKITPRPAEDPEAVLAPFADPAVADRISAAIDQDMHGEEGRSAARDASASRRGGERVVTVHGGTYLLPTVIRCDASHPLANREYLFPFASVVEVPAAAMPAVLGSSLVVTCLSGDPAVPRTIRRLPARRSPESGPHPDDANRLGPATRGESVRSSLCSTGNTETRVVDGQ